MPQEIYDAAKALQDDIVDPLFTYVFVSVALDIFPSSALEGSESFGYIESQLYSSAIAQEYETLRKKSVDIFNSTLPENGGVGMTREIATEYAQTLKDMFEKSVELDTWTVKYIEAMAKLEAGEFVKLVQPELDKFNMGVGSHNKLTLSKLVNNLYRRINYAISAITVETQEEKDAKLYDNPEPSELAGKLPENERNTTMLNTANGSANHVLSSSNDLELVASASSE